MNGVYSCIERVETVGLLLFKLCVGFKYLFIFTPIRGRFPF